jgi:hypothetical protein
MFLVAKSAPLIQQYAPAQCHGESTSSCYATVQTLSSDSPPPDAANPPSSNAGQALGLEKQVAVEECPRGLKGSLRSSWCSTSFASLSMDMDRDGFSADMNDI